MIPKIDWFVASETSHPSKNFLSIRRQLLEFNFLSYQRNSYNCLYPAIEKILFKIFVSPRDLDYHDNLISCCALQKFTLIRPECFELSR